MRARILELALGWVLRFQGSDGPSGLGRVGFSSQKLFEIITLRAQGLQPVYNHTLLCRHQTCALR